MKRFKKRAINACSLSAHGRQDEQAKPEWKTFRFLAKDDEGNA
jgi:hypothetical protein